MKIIKNKYAFSILIAGVLNWILVVFYGDIFGYIDFLSEYSKLFTDEPFNLFGYSGFGYVIGLFINQLIFWGLIYLINKGNQKTKLIFLTFIIELIFLWLIGSKLFPFFAIVVIIIAEIIKNKNSKADQKIKDYDSNEMQYEFAANQSNFNFCKNCGNSINSNAIVCLGCGCDPKRGNKHCNSCGVETNQEQIICIKCGVTLKNQTIASDEGKTVAVIAYLTLIGFIIALVQHSANKTRLGAYHLRQVVGFMVTGVGLGILLWILAMNIFGGDYDSVAKYAVFVGVFSFLVWAVLLVCIIIGLINAVNGKEKPAPIFGEFYEKWFANMFN